MNLFIAKLNPATATKDLQKLFSHYGLVTSVKVIFDHGTGRSKCYGFVEMPNNHEAHEALEELDNTTFQENLITVRESQIPDDRSPEVEAGRRFVPAKSFKNRSNPESKTQTSVIIKPQRDDNSRRNFGYRGGEYRSFL
jgi:RNA recognition motif-containing protein